MSRALVLALIVALQPAQALESIQRGAVEGLSTDVRIVRACGQWRAAERSGHHRIVVVDVQQGAGSELYVQWIADATQERPAVLVATTPIAELNDDHAQYSILRVDCRRVGGATVVDVKATFEHDTTDRVHGMSIRLIDVGRYRLDGRSRR